jgi:hypothetical protein
MECPQCKTDNPADARFCFRCGGALSSAPNEPSTGTLLKIEPGTPDPNAKGTEFKKSPARGDAPQPAALGFAGPDDRYELLEILGRGGMGAVYKAHDRSLDRVVALKRIKSSLSDEENFQRFTREAQSFAKMHHPNIAILYDYGRDAQGPFLVMEHVQGEPLNVRLARRGALPPEQAVGIFEGICAGVMHAHEKGVVHRDIKPANVIIDSAGTPKLLDFGLARGNVESDMSQTGNFLGTHDYAAPEQKRDAKNVDHRADVYSMGATLYEILSGNRPVPLLLAKLPLHWQFVIGKACEPEPKDRYQSVRELLAAIRGVPLNATPSVPPPPRAAQQNDLACPECGTANLLEAGKCVKCSAPLWTKCGICHETRRVGLRACNRCNASVMIGAIAAAHRERGEAALKDKRLRDALEELTELEFLLTRSGDDLGPAAAWLPWTKAQAAGARQRSEQARKLAAQAREADDRGMVAAAAQKLEKAAQLDSAFLQEFAILAQRTGVAPERRTGKIEGDSSSSSRNTTFDTLTQGTRFVSGNAFDEGRTRAGSDPRRASMKVKCNACGAGFLTRQEVIEKQKACPRCGVTPFAWTDRSTT